MITWTVTTRPENNPEIITSSGAEPDLATAKRAAADAVRYALLDAREHVSPDNGCAPSYLVTLDGNFALIVGLGRCRTANFNGVLDSLERFDGTGEMNLLYL
ncbi:hypothetical protein CH260_20405 [Rhodococcus sp. 05-2256-B2]|uniref:hypothetical protein n=1 Tax=unclassified Rhodococcus (in: high G+C Gram-positive bacteria) TaxID=192944 RepID=UPI000B9A9A72|nr:MULTISPECIES: hypothetical protein [unclassified Rhodococcus (in: high G+C Gram-positive bacteria)]OZD85310.1 hypothetical protein CH258_13935 [Rhodococcus sp. 05-2256-B4]OZD92456.1 hypothetical protein CH260_20405 [Rhodococcus sp. 05-2256-B2]OZD99318.1 hypothetical protein CH257_00695 [Rhodococcus sp. 05-2256-B3]OZE02842.1 hypothetical protein CH285_12810 [Rhodococcus sp. 05-2256-B1]